MCTPRRTLVERFAVRQSPPKTELPANGSIRGAKNKYERSLGVTPTATFTGRPVVADMRAIISPLDPDRAMNLDKISIAEVCFGSNSEVGLHNRHVRSYPV